MKQSLSSSSLRSVPIGLSWTSLLSVAGSLAAQTPTPAPQPKPAGEVTDLPEVVVSAETDKVYKPERLQSPKYTAPLREIPQTITVIPKEMIQDQGALNLTEVLRNIPGITALAGEGGGAAGTAGDTFFMRGFDATNSIFVDGVRNNGAVSRDVFNLEQVEVFKGPTGSDTGRATASGYVNLSTKTPKMEEAYSGNVSYGSADQKRLTVDGNLPIKLGDGQDLLGGSAFRLNGLWQEGGVPGRDYVERESYAIAPSLAFGLSGPVRLYLSSVHMRQTNTPDYGIPSNAIMRSNPLYDPSISRDNFYGSIRDQEDIEQDSYTARIEWDINDNFTLRNQLFYSETERFAVVTTPGNSDAAGNVARTRNVNHRINKIFSNQTNLNGKFSTGPLKHSVAASLEYIWEEQFAPTYVAGSAGAMPAADAHNPNPYDPITGYNPRKNGNQYTDGETDTYAVSLFDTISIGDKWQINGGFRYEYYDTRYRATNAAGAHTTNLSTAGDLFSWKAGIVYKPLPNGTVYLSYGVTKTPPGSANFALNTTVNNANNANAAPQESTNLELGTKWDFFNERLAFSAALFRTENTNEITVNPADPTDINTNSKRQVDGIELGVTGQITDKWSLYTGFAYLDATFADSANPTNAGSNLQWTPQYSGSLWTTYKLPHDVTVGLGARYMGEIQRQNTNAPAAVSPNNPDYWVFDAMVQYQVNEKFSLRLNLYNLADELYASGLNNNGQRVTPGAPFSAMLTASYKF